jgi:hypothetical protein
MILTSRVKGRDAIKFQIPGSPHQRSSKFQHPILVFGYWVFSGTWIWGLGCRSSSVSFCLRLCGSFVSKQPISPALFKAIQACGQFLPRLSKASAGFFQGYPRQLGTFSKAIQACPRLSKVILEKKDCLFLIRRGEPGPGG